MELAGLPCPTDDLLNRLLRAVPQPTPAKRKAPTSKFLIKPSLGLLHLDIDACMPAHPFAYHADLGMAVLLLFCAALHLSECAVGANSGVI